MCTGYRGIFRLPIVGRIGGIPVDRQFMDNVEQRALDIKRVCRINKVEKQQTEQMVLPDEKK